MGELEGSIRPRDFPAAAMPKRTLAPHAWHFVVVEPTSVPQEGQRRGRAFDGSPPKNDFTLSRSRSSFHCKRGESGKQTPCERFGRAPIIAEIEKRRVKRGTNLGRGRQAMKDFEEFGRWLDEEMKRVVHVVETEIRPTAEKKVIAALRTASSKLAEVAKELEERRARSGA
jgi:hypothetical protein